MVLNQTTHPRKGRHHKVRRVNAGGKHAPAPNHPGHARGDIIKPGVSTPGGETRVRLNHPSPARGDIIEPGVGNNGLQPNNPSPARGDIVKPGVSTPGGDTHPPESSEPRKGRHHKARRANARDNGPRPNKLSSRSRSGFSLTIPILPTPWPVQNVQITQRRFPAADVAPSFAPEEGEALGRQSMKTRSTAPLRIVLVFVAPDIRIMILIVVIPAAKGLSHI